MAHPLRDPGRWDPLATLSGWVIRSRSIELPPSALSPAAEIPIGTSDVRGMGFMFALAVDGRHCVRRQARARETVACDRHGFSSVQNLRRCSPAHCVTSGIGVGNKGIKRSTRQPGSVPKVITGPSGGADGLATQLNQLSSERTVQRVIPALGQRIRVGVRAGSGVPLVLCNGIGASLEVLDPLVDQLNPDTTVVRFDVPGIGGSADSPLPYNFPYLAVVLGRVLSAVGLGGEGIDVLGLSWGGALAQQFAFQNPRRCRHLISGVDRHWHRDGAG